MAIKKIVKQNFQNLKNTRQSDLYDSINKFMPESTDETKGVVAGLIIEYVIQSGGNPDIFVDELLVEQEEDENDDLYLD